MVSPVHCSRTIGSRRQQFPALYRAIAPCFGNSAGWSGVACIADLRGLPFCFSCHFRSFPVIPCWPPVPGRPAGMAGGLCSPNFISTELILGRWRQAWQGANDSKMQLQPWKTRLPCGPIVSNGFVAIGRTPPGQSHLKNPAGVLTGAAMKAGSHGLEIGTLMPDGNSPGLVRR